MEEICDLRKRISEPEQPKMEGRPLAKALQGDQVVGARKVGSDMTERKRTALETATIAEIGRIIGSSPEIDEVFSRFAAEVRKLIPFDRLLGVSLNNFRDRTLRIAYAVGNAGRKVGGTFPLSGSLNEILVKTRRGILIQPDRVEDLAGLPTVLANYNKGVHSLMSVPLISRNVVIGALHFRSEQPHAYTERDLHVAERIGEQIAGAIDHAQLFGKPQVVEK
jgi:GAF domain-containing protein